MQKAKVPSSTNEIMPLTGLRGIAAISVVILHVSGSLGSHKFWINHNIIITNLISGGDFAVDIFFMLSGFVLMLNYGTSNDKLRFFVYRFARIFPLNTFVLGLMALGVFILLKIGFHFNQQDYSYFKFRYLPYHFTLIFVWLGMPIAWNGPAWSLSAEMFAYCLFPLLQLAVKRLTRRQVATIVVAFIGFQTLNLVILGFQVTGGDALLRASLGFFVGAGMSLVTVNERGPVYWPDILALSVVVLVSLGLSGYAVLPAALLIQALSLPGRSICHRVLGSYSMVLLGRWSYSIYLLHAPLLIGCLIGLRHFRQFQGGLGLALFVALYSVLIVITSALSYLMIENPSRSFLQRCWKRSRLARPTPNREVA